MFPNLARIENDVRISEHINENAPLQHPVSLHFRSFTFREKVIITTFIALAIIAIVVALIHYDGYLDVPASVQRVQFVANIVMGVSGGVLAIAIGYLVARHLLFKKEIDRLINQDDVAHATYDGRSSRLSEEAICRYVLDKKGYHVIFERDPSEHSKFFFPHLNAFENHEAKPLKNKIVFEPLSGRQKCIAFAVNLLALGAMFVALIFYSFGALATWEAAVFATCGSMLGFTMALYTIQLVRLKKRADAFLGGWNEWKPPANFNLINERRENLLCLGTIKEKCPTLVFRGE